MPAVVPVVVRVKPSLGVRVSRGKHTDSIQIITDRYGVITLHHNWLIANNYKLKLTKCKAALLGAVMEANGEIVRTKELAALIGYCEEANSHTVQNHFYRLRRNLQTMEIVDLIEGIMGPKHGGYRIRLTH